MSLEYATRASVTIDGLPIDRSLEPSLSSVVVADHLHLPDMFEIVLLDPDGEALPQIRARIGSAVRISGTPLGQAGGGGAGAEDPLIDGEVTALEGRYGPGGVNLVIRGYDLSHRMMGGTRTETYRDVTDSDIARTVAGRAGIPVGRVDESDILHEHVSQAGQSDWDFLRARAREIGFEVAVREGRLDFKRSEQASQAPGEGDYRSTDRLQLVWGTTKLIRFHPRVTASEQVRSVEVRGWDPKQKKAIVGQATAATVSAAVEDTPGALADVSGRDRWVAAGRPLWQQSAVDEAAAAEAERIASAHAEAEGVARGDPALKAGAAVSISGVGRFSGRYLLTQTTHVFDESGYQTRFVISGRQDRSLLGLASMGAASAIGRSGGPAMRGLSVAIVTDNADPDDLGRVKLRFPTLDEAYESDWARVAQLGAGPDSGAVFLPDVNDEVLVGFESGDIRRPYVVGGLYNGVDKPRLGDGLIDNGHVKRRGLISRAGHRIVFLDDDAKSGVALLSGDDSLRIALRQSDSSLTIASDGSISITAGGKVTLEAGSDLTVKAGGSLTLEGQAGVKVKSGGIVDIDGSLIELN